MKTPPDSLYKHDYIVALITHGFSWSFMTMLPIAAVSGFNPPVVFWVCFVVNAALHSWIDDLKANKLKINLITDQSLHIIQIVVTYLIIMGIFKWV